MPKFLQLLKFSAVKVRYFLPIVFIGILYYVSTRSHLVDKNNGSFETRQRNSAYFSALKPPIDFATYDPVSIKVKKKVSPQETTTASKVSAF